MDTSKLYIDMCSKATEIQNIKLKNEGVNDGDFAFEDGDYFIDRKGNINVFHGVANYEGAYQSFSAWLPKQDDLQEILKDLYTGYKYPLFTILEQLDKYPGIHNFESYEQMWLLVVMKKKYNMLWDTKLEYWCQIES